MKRMSRDKLRQLCESSLERWALELTARVGPEEASRLLKAAAIASLCATYGTGKAAEMLRQDAERLAAMSGPVGHA